MYSTTQVAKKCGIKSANYLNKMLEALGVQTSFMYNDRKYWKLTPPYQNKGYDTYSKKYAENVTRPMLLETLHWTDKGVKFVEDLVDAWYAWHTVYAEEPVSALHAYTNKAGREVVQLIRYNPDEPLDGTRAYISERIRRAFVKDVEKSAYRNSKRFWGGPSYAVDSRDPEMLERWQRWIQNYYRFNVSL